MSSQRKPIAERMKDVQIKRALKSQKNLKKAFSVEDLGAATDIILYEYKNRESAPRIKNKSIREAYRAMQIEINRKLNKKRASSRLSLGSVAPHLGNQESSPRASPSRRLSDIREETAVGGRKTRRRNRKNRKSTRLH